MNRYTMICDTTNQPMSADPIKRYSQKPTNTGHSSSMNYDEENYEKNTHTFVIKIWLEEMIGKYRLPRWRGHITYIPSGERRYFENLNEITKTIHLYLDRIDTNDNRWIKRIYHWIWSLIH
jgi:hypothetical protein